MQHSRRQLSFDAESLESTICTLCKGHHRRFSTPETWRNAEARSLAASLTVNPDDPVCYACRKELTRVLSDSAYVPRWEKLSTTNPCCIDECLHNAFALLKKFSHAELQSGFLQGGLKSRTSTIPTPTPLCKHHYHMIYNLVRPTQTKCVTCGTYIKPSTSKFCPNPSIIEAYLHDTTDFDVCICESDKVCYACYRAHLVVLKKGGNTESIDSDLEQVINTLSRKVPSEASSIQEAIDSSMNRIAIYVGQQLLEGNALLLPSIKVHLSEEWKSMLSGV